MLCVEYQAQIQQLRFLIAVLPVISGSRQEILRRALVGHSSMQVQRSAVDIAAFCGVAMRHNDRRPSDETHGQTQFILQSHSLRIRIIGIEGQDTASELVHQVAAGGTEDLIFCEHRGQRAQLVQHLVEPVQFFSGRQVPHKEQECRLLIAKTPFGGETQNQILYIDPPIDHLARHGHSFAVLHIIAIHIANLCHAHHNAGSIMVPQTALDVHSFGRLWVDLITLGKFLAHLVEKVIGSG